MLVACLVQRTRVPQGVILDPLLNCFMIFVKLASVKAHVLKCHTKLNSLKSTVVLFIAKAQRAAFSRISSCI